MTGEASTQLDRSSSKNISSRKQSTRKLKIVQSTGAHNADFQGQSSSVFTQPSVMERLANPAVTPETTALVGNSQGYSQSADPESPLSFQQPSMNENASQRFVFGQMLDALPHATNAQENSFGHHNPASSPRPPNHSGSGL